MLELSRGLTFADLVESLYLLVIRTTLGSQELSVSMQVKISSVHMLETIES